MKTKLHLVLATMAACAGLLSIARANTIINWTFQENGSNVNLGPVSTFVEDGFGLTAYGFRSAGLNMPLVPGTPSALFAKFTLGDPGETGLGMAEDSHGQAAAHEIDKLHFVQLDSVLKPTNAGLDTIWLGSVQGSEDGSVFGSNVLGTLGVKLATISSDGSIDISPWLGVYRYFGVQPTGSKYAADVLVTSLQAAIPDGGTTALLLGFGLLGVGLIARRLRA